MDARDVAARLGVTWRAMKTSIRKAEVALEMVGMEDQIIRMEQQTGGRPRETYLLSSKAMPVVVAPFINKKNKGEAWEVLRGN